MTKNEKLLIAQYMYCAEERLVQAVKDTEYRFVRRDLDSVDLLEEIIAKEHLNCFRSVMYDIVRLLKLDREDNEITQHLKIYTGADGCTGGGEMPKHIGA